MQSLVVVEGYGPPNLVDEVRNVQWVLLLPEGSQFTGIDLKGFFLVSDPSLISSQKYRAIFFEVPRGSGDEFTITGYEDPHLLEHLRAGNNMPVRFGNCAVILESNSNLHRDAYRLIVEKI